MEVHNENKLYIVTCNCIIYCRNLRKIKIVLLYKQVKRKYMCKIVIKHEKNGLKPHLPRVNTLSQPSIHKNNNKN